jgi:chorismate mutase
MLLLEELRSQIDAIDQSIIQTLSRSGEEEDCLDSVSELTDEDKQMLRSTRLRFSQRVCELLSQRIQISRQIGEVKHAE